MQKKCDNKAQSPSNFHRKVMMTTNTIFKIKRLHSITFFGIIMFQKILIPCFLLFRSIQKALSLPSPACKRITLLNPSRGRGFYDRKIQFYQHNIVFSSLNLTTSYRSHTLIQPSVINIIIKEKLMFKYLFSIIFP